MDGRGNQSFVSTLLTEEAARRWSRRGLATAGFGKDQVGKSFTLGQP